MLIQYHKSITRKALAEQFSPRALETVLAANINQDNLLTGQIGHDEYHYDNNAIPKSDRYLEEQRTLALSALKNNNLPAAWAAFGRLLHTAQDFYAHSNYVDLWLARYEGNNQTQPAPSEIVPLLDELVRSPDLHSGKVYYLWEILAVIPVVKGFVIPHMPADSHARMQLDSTACGERFAYALEAAVKRTRYEFDKTVADLSSDLVTLFTDLSS